MLLPSLPLFPLLCDLVHGVGKVANVGRGDSGDGDAAVLGQVHAVVLDDLGDLEKKFMVSSEQRIAIKN